ncbi:MAG TPA: glycoside hydrolase family 3 N-terminal domain-containing protein [Acidimicrobiales bacterium]|nr:glycoside hydrolase family 3 N-terminal domain-containing protein [Acidimicrobiales bacterium]
MPTPPQACPSLGDEVRLWSLPERAAQLIVVPSLDFNIASLSGPLTGGAGGVLFLGSTPAPTDLAARIRSAVVGAGPTEPPFVMADEEGGGVQRLAGAVSSIPWPRDLAASYTTQAVRTLAANVGSQMLRAGVGVDLAPVLDVDGGVGPSAADPDGARSFSARAPVAADYGTAFMSGLRDGGVFPVVKHFPGLGSSSGNTDVGPARTQPLAVLEQSGLVPFRAAITAGVPGVMVANASVPGLTSQPASLSSAVIQGLLEGELGFKGLVLTDSLSAGAITQAGLTLDDAAVAAVQAGADMVLFGSTLTPADVRALSPDQVEATFGSLVDALVSAVSSGKLPAQRLDDAVTHVLEAKRWPLCPTG